jgi:hypothetical protein
MKPKPSQKMLIAMLLLASSNYFWLKYFEIWGLIGWMVLMVALGVQASSSRAEEKRLERSLK